MRRVIGVGLLALLGIFGMTWWAAGSGPTDAEVANARDRLDDDVFRVVVLGDSLARGAGDENGLGVSGYLNRELRTEVSGPSAVVNLGVNGARTRNVAALLNHEASRSSIEKADLVVISLGGNDLFGDSRARLLSRILPAANGNVQSRNSSGSSDPFTTSTRPHESTCSGSITRIAAARSQRGSIRK